jgi:GT2 family glycosyltransferase
MSQRTVAISVVVCSNRPTHVDPAVYSVLANPEVEELLLVLQGPQRPSAEMLQLHEAGRLRVIEDSGSGLSRARNIGIKGCRGRLILFTDDDCVVAPDWIARHIEVHREHPQAALVFGSVHPPEIADASLGVTPTLDPQSAADEGRLRGSLVLGMGANMSVKSEAFTDVGLFDEVIGAGAPLASSEDVDFALRACAAGFEVIADSRPRVIHETGARPLGAASRKLWRRDGIGIGAVIAKCVRAGDWRGAMFLMNFLAVLNKKAIARLAHGQAGSGVRMAAILSAGSVEGAFSSLRWQLSREHGRCLSPTSA